MLFIMKGLDVGLNCKLGISWNAKEQKVVCVCLGGHFPDTKCDTTYPSRWYTFEPLWYNSYVTHNSNIITDTVIQQFISLGITQVKHLREIKSYESQFRSKWIFESLKCEITETSLPQHW